MNRPEHAEYPIGGVASPRTVRRPGVSCEGQTAQSRRNGGEECPERHVSPPAGSAGPGDAAATRRSSPSRPPTAPGAPPRAYWSAVRGSPGRPTGGPTGGPGGRSDGGPGGGPGGRPDGPAGHGSGQAAARPALPPPTAPTPNATPSAPDSMAPTHGIRRGRPGWGLRPPVPPGMRPAPPRDQSFPTTSRSPPSGHRARNSPDSSPRDRRARLTAPHGARGSPGG
jgi:hypothetical protein